MRIAFNPGLVMWRGRPRPRNAKNKIVPEGNLVPYLLLLFALIIPQYATAQRAAGHAAAPGHATSHFNSSHGNFALGGYGHRSGFGRNSSYPYGSAYASLPFPFFGDSFDPDDIYSTGYPVASQPPAFLLQAMRGMAGPAADSFGPAASPFNNGASSSSQPLMIELQNGRYVRIKSTAANGIAVPLTPAPGAAQSAKLSRSRPIQPSAAAVSPPHDLPSAILIFRDGHSEEVRDYAIADGILYARGDYYTDGYWNKKIALSTLNVAQTLEVNSTRNVKFVLPSSPNEVITRP